ncbi:type IV pilus assembly protein PilM [Stomatohabitans albus]|uniref:type IV pilus assembly protein PilM n=1 Tax=Stomatohabitans albus TaxID=3110766 RepID=UPI00300C2436
MAKTLIGLDIGATAVRAVEIDHTGPVPSLLRLGQVRLPAGVCAEGKILDIQIVSDAVRQLWEQQAFSSSRAAVGVASQQVVTRALNLPEMPLDQIKANLALHARESLPMAPEDTYMDYQYLGTTATEQGVAMNGLLVAVARDYVDQLTDVIEFAGLIPAAVDLDGFALTRAYANGLAQLDFDIMANQTVPYDATGSAPPRTPGHVLVHVGATLTLVVVVSGGLPRFVRTIMMGGQTITDALADTGSLNPEQAERLKMEQVDPNGQFGRIIQNHLLAFSDEIQNSINFYRTSGNAVELADIVLSGGGALMIGLGDTLARQINLNVMYGSTLNLLDTSHVLADQATLSAADPFLPLAVGLTSAPVN